MVSDRDVRKHLKRLKRAIRKAQDMIDRLNATRQRSANGAADTLALAKRAMGDVKIHFVDNLAPYDLELPAKDIYPTITPLKDKILAAEDKLNGRAESSVPGDG